MSKNGSGTTAAEYAGVLLIDKPLGWTSHDVVGRARRLVGQRRIGHTGTLDPNATGLLILCLGRATRLAEYIVGHDKWYEGVIRLGVQTSTDDTEGTVIKSGTPPPLGEATLVQLERQFTGTLQQRPPAFSAVRINGQRGYVAARRGAPLDLPVREVVVHSLRLVQESPCVLRAEVHCRPGTYIRSLARDLGEALGCGGHLASLRRTKVGSACVGDAFTLDELEVLRDQGELPSAIRPPDWCIADMDAALVSADHARQIRHGLQVHADAVGSALAARVYGPDGEFLAISAVTPQGMVRPLKVLAVESTSEDDYSQAGAILSET